MVRYIGWLFYVENNKLSKICSHAKCICLGLKFGVKGYRL
jgi:hypothetical protein